MSGLGAVSIDEEPLVLRFSGELDAGDPTFSTELLEKLGEARHVIIDMLNVSFIDSSVILGLVLAHRSRSEMGGWVRVVYTHHLLRRVIDICGLAEVLPQYPTIEAAERGSISLPPTSESPSQRESRP